MSQNNILAYCVQERKS